MRATAPWLISLLLHSLFLLGMFFFTRIQPEVPPQLTLDFEIIPQAVTTIEEPGPSVEPPVVEKTQAAVAEVPAQPEKLPTVVKELSPTPHSEAKASEPPPPVPEVRTAEPAEIVETDRPRQPTGEDLLPAAAPTAVDQPAVAKERQMMPPAATNSGREKEEAEAALQAKTIRHVRGQVLNQLEYPSIARRRGWHGKLVLGFILCADGSVEDLVVLKSSGHSILDRSALHAVAKTAPFSGGYPRTEVRLPINFQLN